MRRQIIAVVAILMLAASAFAIATASRASATDGGGDCVPTEGHYTEWSDSGPVVKVEPDVADPVDKEFERWLFLGTEEEVLDPGHTEEVFDYWQRYSWTGGPHTEDSPPAFPSPDWQPNVQGDPHGVGVEGAYFRSSGNSGRGDWFYLEAVTKTVTHPPVTQTLRLYQPQTREWVEGKDCPPEPCPDGEVDYNGEEPGCGEPPECPDGDFNGDQDGCGEPPVEECPEGQTGTPPDCETPEEPPVNECPVEPSAANPPGRVVADPDCGPDHEPPPIVKVPPKPDEPKDPQGPEPPTEQTSAPEKPVPTVVNSGLTGTGAGLSAAGAGLAFIVLFALALGFVAGRRRNH